MGGRVKAKVRMRVSVEGEGRVSLFLRTCPESLAWAKSAGRQGGLRGGAVALWLFWLSRAVSTHLGTQKKVCVSDKYGIGLERG